MQEGHLLIDTHPQPQRSRHIVRWYSGLEDEARCVAGWPLHRPWPRGWDAVLHYKQAALWVGQVRIVRCDEIMI